jgi:hypothetical protein
MTFLAFFLRSRVAGRFPLPDLSLQGTGTSTDRGFADRLIARRSGQIKDDQNWDVTIETENGRDKVVQSLHSVKYEISRR